MACGRFLFVDVPFGLNLSGFTGQLCCQGLADRGAGHLQLGLAAVHQSDGDTLNVDLRGSPPEFRERPDPDARRRADDRALVQHRRVCCARDHDPRHVVAQSAGRPGPQGGRRLDLEGVQADHQISFRRRRSTPSTG